MNTKYLVGSLMRFVRQGEISFPEGVDSEEKLREMILNIRIEEVDRRLRIAMAEHNEQLILWLRTRKQYILNTKIHGNVAVAGNLYTNKVYIPIQEFPDTNFVGLIIGPRGSTLKQLERITRARIYVRGSYKDKYMEPLHCHIAAESQEELQSATAIIENLIEDFAFSKDGDGSRLKKQQLIEMGYKEKTMEILTDWEKFYRWWYFHNRIQ